MSIMQEKVLSKEKIYQSYNEALYALNQRLIQGWNGK